MGDLLTVASRHLDIVDVNKSYGPHAALSGVSLSIAKGSMNFLLGANGSGKSTLLKCVAGHEYWDSGDIFYNGFSRKIDRKNFNLGMHFISEDIQAPQCSLGQLKSLYQDIYKKWDEAIFQKFLNWGDLKFSDTLTAVSRGQRMQGLLALSLSCGPEILLIDEATAVLDPFIRNRFMLEIDRLHKTNGMTTVVATNIGTEVALLKGRLLIMEQGKLVVDKSAEAIGDGFVKVRIALADVDQITSAGFSLIDKNEDDSVSFLGKREELAKLKVHFLEDKRAISVDEIFIFHSDRKKA
jgi:ABC-2 type transport system ATP-binding protein